MYDIASVKYKQLCEICKIDNENLEVTEEEKPMEWQPKSRRMMQLCLTDGVQDVTAIEYTLLKQMTVYLYSLLHDLNYEHVFTLTCLFVVAFTFQILVSTLFSFKAFLINYDSFCLITFLGRLTLVFSFEEVSNS